ncbi:hypothetical protein PLICRDRAFT_55462 [Plicaturopsis crispa FD-325 SS-3]|nr:hypothetical protein PLICRDRAFT_55462 [Plicaturopsis crispa FD-325 SS-3]
MENAERLVRTWIASGRDQEIEETASGVSDGQITLLNIVKALGEYLTADEDVLRTKGVEFLSAVLLRCSPDKINRQSARVLTVFYCGKLEDTETIIPALKGMVSLLSLPSCTPTDAVDIANAVFANVTMKALEQPARFVVFTIFDTLMARHRDALKGMGKSFVSKYVGIAEGEKDPRNLLLAFAIARVILIEFDISDNVEGLFNITFCYFPISFRPPPDYKHAVTPDDLKNSLRACLNATPAFGPLSIPLFIDKLTAGSPATKRDTLQTISACLPVYGAALARTSARKLWSSFKLEIFQPTDPVTEEEALKATQTLIKTIYGDGASADAMDTDIQGLARDACQECIEILREPEKSQARPATKVLCAFMSTTPSVCRFTISQAVPHFVKLFLDPDEVSNRPAVLSLLSDLIVAARDSATVASSDSDAAEEVFILPFKDAVLGVFTVGLKTQASRRSALAGLKGLVTTKHLLTDDELGFVVHNTNEALQADIDELEFDTSDSTLDLLSTISSTTPRHVEEQTLPLLFSTLPDQSPARDAAAERAKCWRVLSSLRTLCLQPALFETLVIRLSTKLDLICAPTKLPTPDADSEPSAAYAHSILTTLSNTLSDKVDKGHTDVPKYIDRLVPRLYNLFIYSALQPESNNPATDPRVVRVAAEIITLIVQTVPVQRQETYASSLFAAFLDGDYSKVAEGQQKIAAGSNFRPFEPSATSVQRNLVALFAAAVVALHKEITIPSPNPSEFLRLVAQWKISTADNLVQKSAACHIISAVINKRAEDVTEFLSWTLDTFWSQEISNASAAAERRRSGINAWIWISKALLVRNHPKASAYTDRLFEIFGDKDIGWDAARAIGTIGGGDKILTKRNHAIIKLLYAQRFLNQILPRLVDGAKNAAEPETQSAYLVALTSLIKSLPKTVFAPEIPALMPLLLRGLELDDHSIRANVIDTLLAVTDGSSNEQNAISEHASTLVTAMLNNSTYKIPSARVRISALRFLAVLPSIVRYDVLHPYKANVIRQLAIALDDPKRSVRKEAVDARTNWYKYNGK